MAATQSTLIMRAEQVGPCAIAVDGIVHIERLRWPLQAAYIGGANR